MVGFDRRPLMRAARAPLVAIAALAFACGPRPAPKTLPPQTASAKPEPQQAPPAEPPVAAKPKDDTTVMIDDGGVPAKRPDTLVEASQAERERRQSMEKPVARIDNQNLKAYAAKGQLTTAEPPATKQPPGAAAPADPGQGESYWRSRGRAIRARWRDAVDEIAVQQKEADRLRTDFYAADDPYYRDARIKPAWDRALDLLAKARKDAESAKGELAVFLEEGQRAAIAPGWLQDGQELEPEETKEPTRKPTPAPGQPREPVVVDEKPPR